MEWRFWSEGRRVTGVTESQGSQSRKTDGQTDRSVAARSPYLCPSATLSLSPGDSVIATPVTFETLVTSSPPEVPHACQPGVADLRFCRRALLREFSVVDGGAAPPRGLA